MSAGLGLRSLALFVGAGWTGSYMYTNLTVERVREIAAQILRQHKEDDNGSSSGDADADTSGSSIGRSAVDALTSQVYRLTREVSRIRAQESVVVVGGGGGSSGYHSVIGVVSDIFNFLVWAVFVCSAGGALYFAFVWKWLSVKDIVSVSQTKFNETINAMQSGIKRVTGAVGSVCKDLGERMLKMEGKVEDVEANLNEDAHDEPRCEVEVDDKDNNNDGSQLRGCFRC